MHVEKDDVSDKNAAVAAILCLLFGSLGLHRFYVGKYITGFIYLIFGASLISVQILSRFFSFRGFLISVIILLFIIVAVIYDLYALYTECFLDSKGKIIMSGARQDELVGRTFEEKFNAKLTIFCAIMLFIIFVIFYRLLILSI